MSDWRQQARYTAAKQKSLCVSVQLLNDTTTQNKYELRASASLYKNHDIPIMNQIFKAGRILVHHFSAFMIGQLQKE